MIVRGRSREYFFQRILRLFCSRFCCVSHLEDHNESLMTIDDLGTSDARRVDVLATAIATANRSLSIVMLRVALCALAFLGTAALRPTLRPAHQQTQKAGGWQAAALAAFCSASLLAAPTETLAAPSALDAAIATDQRGI